MTLKYLLLTLTLHTSLYTTAIRASSEGKQNLEDRYQALETFARALFFMESLYVDPENVKQDKLIRHAIQGIVAELDPHTMVMPKRAFEQLTSDTKGKFGGVGIIVSQERGKLIVVSPIEDTPAMQAGVRSGDEIIAIDNIPISKMPSVEAVEKMRGDPGSTIVLDIKRKEETDVLRFKLVREVIKVKSVRSQELASGIYYARITSFQEDTADELEAILKKSQKNLKGLILDLRDNPGGLLDQAVKVTDRFIESGLVVSTVGRDPQRVEREFARKRGTYLGFPMITLVNDGSASASEIVAGALQDHERSLIMGTQTFGKGSVQTLVSLPDGSGLKLTVARYYTPKDRSIQAKGITPDIVVENDPQEGKKSSKLKKEAQLEGHLSSKDLSDFSNSTHILKDIESWPEHIQKDRQLVTSYTYLKGWTVFQQPGTVTKPSPTTPAEKKEVKG
jgi:carboxyl-terminal processing protease